jgi:hypothetical protein
MQLVASKPSKTGFNNSAAIISLQDALSRLESWRARPDGRQARDLLAVPALHLRGALYLGLVGWWLGGHHLSLSYTLIDG